MKKVISWLVIVCGLAGVSGAQVPLMLNYQGKLINGTNLYNGQAGITFRLYDAYAPSAVYECSSTVAVVDGLYSAYIGSNTVFGDLAGTLAFGPVTLEVVVNGNVLSPREPLASAAYALLSAGVVNGAIGTHQLADGSVDSSKLAAGAVTSAAIATASISSNKIDWSTMPPMGGGAYVSKSGDIMTGALTINEGGLQKLTIDSGGSDVAIGNGANGDSDGTALGYLANGNDWGAAVGGVANANHLGVALGRGANGYYGGAAVGWLANGGDNGVAAGAEANASSYGTAIGESASATNRGVAVGYLAVGNDLNTAIGYSAKAQTDSTAVGAQAGASNRSLAAGHGAGAVDNSIALGWMATGRVDSTAMGELARAYDVSIALGKDAFATYRSTAIAGYASNECVAIAGLAADGSTALGYHSDARSGSVSVGYEAVADIFSVVVGRYATATYEGVSIGDQSVAGAFGVAVGSRANGDDAGVAVGYCASATNMGTAVGQRATATSGGVAVGNYANGNQYGTALGEFAHGSESGAAVGNSANGENLGAAVGYSSDGHDQGAALGAEANGWGQCVAVGANANAAEATHGVAIGFCVTNDISDSTRVRGDLYLDGSGNTIYYRTSFGSGGWSTKTFTIDHPLDPQNKVLRHYCLEGPDVWNVYAGNAVLAAGRAVVELPAYYAALNKAGSEIVTLTPWGKEADVYVVGVEGLRLTIGGNKDVKVSWTIKVLRNDPACIDDLKNRPVEQLKSELKPGQAGVENRTVNTMAVSP